jgi:hypothetical protein
MERGRKDYLQVTYQYPDGTYKVFLIREGTVDDFCSSFSLNKENIVDIERVRYRYTFDQSCPKEVSVPELNK